MLSELMNALKAGQELSNASTWKNAQNLTSALTAVAGVAMYFMHQNGVNINIGDSDISNMVTAGFTIYGVINGLITTATSKKIGL